MGNIRARIERLEQAINPKAASVPQVVIYQPGERPKPGPPDGRLRVYVPDNGRGPSPPEVNREH